MRNSSRVLVALMLAGGASALASAVAHHSMERFDTQQKVTVSGEIIRYEWANPHVYIFIEETKANGETVEWEIEGGPPAMMRRDGWSRQTLQPGQRVSAIGNPGRNQYKDSMYLTKLERADETLFAEEEWMGAMMSAGDAPRVPAESLDGVWTTLLDVPSVLQFYPANIGDNATAKGLAAIEAFDETTMHPGLNCVAFSAPTMMISPDIKRIQLEDDKLIIGGEFDGAERTIHLDVTSHDGVEPSIQGHSIGRWDGEVLVIESAKFADHAVGTGFGLPSGAQKTLVERLYLDEDRTTLSYEFELSDPEFIKEPMTGKITWVHTPGTTFAPEPCDLENARRFITD